MCVWDCVCFCGVRVGLVASVIKRVHVSVNVLTVVRACVRA